MSPGIIVRIDDYKGYVIDMDNLGRIYIYNKKSPYSEDSDRCYVGASKLSEAKKIIDLRIETGRSDICCVEW